MSRITPVSPQRLIRVFEKAGFTISRRRGDHVVMTKPGISRPLVVVTAEREVPVTHIMTNLRTAGISRQEYLSLLAETG